jgi:hypothetical protein
MYPDKEEASKEQKQLVSIYIEYTRLYGNSWKWSEEIKEKYKKATEHLR